MISSLRIGRLRNNYLAPRDHPAPERLRSELDEAARCYVPESCGQALSLMLDPGDASVWVIEKISVDLLMDIAVLPAEKIAEVWARRLAELVAKTMARGEDGERVMHFPNRAAYLAHFLRDLAGGNAWGKWYYRQFDSLRSLPAPAAIREALFREAELAEAVLLELVKSNSLNRVISPLSERDHGLMLELCALTEIAPTRDCFEAALDVFKALRQRTSSSALEFYLHLRMEHQEYAAGEARGAVRHVLTIEKWAQQSRLSTILTELERNELSHILAGLPVEEQETGSFLYFQAGATPGLLQKVAETTEAVMPPEKQFMPSRTAADGTFRAESSFGGVFLLLPALIQSRDLMRVYGREQDAHLRYLLLLFCAMNSADAWRDPALFLAAGLNNVPDAIALQEVRHREHIDSGAHDLLAGDSDAFIAAGRESFPGLSLGEAAGKDLAAGAAALLRAFARSLPGLGKSSPEFLWRNILSGHTHIFADRGRILVQPVPRPLQIIVRMAGLHDTNFDLPWKPGIQVTIRFDEE